MHGEAGGDKRFRAIAALRFIRADIERQQQLRPDPDTLIPAYYVRRYNDALRAVANELGEDRARVLHIGRERIMPAAIREGQPVDAYGRDNLLASVKDLLGRLGAD